MSIGQATQFGQVYSASELAGICDFAHRNDLLVHVDGARLANAAAALGITMKEAVGEAEVVSLGGTKNGLMGADAVVVMNPERMKGKIAHIQKQALQLPSKMRFLSAQFLAYFEDDLWLKNATHANQMLNLLYSGLLEIGGIEFLHNPDANLLFAYLPHAAAEKLLKEYSLYLVANEDRGSLIRCVASFDTTEDQIEHFLKTVESVMVES